MNQADLFPTDETETRAMHIRMARVFIQQARATPWPGFRARLLSWAADRRTKANKKPG